MKKLFAGLINGMIALGMCLSLLWGAVGPVSAENGFAGETGTQADPYLVGTAEQLNSMRDHLGAHFKLVADINLGVPPWNEGTGWEPVGTSGANFTGSLDGDGYAIYNLLINRPGTELQGLFGVLGNATVSDLRLVNVNVSGNHSTGGLTGLAVSSTIEHVHVSGWISGQVNTGGLVGLLNGGSMQNCISAGDIMGTMYTGGLVGSTNYGTISGSYSFGSVEGNDYVGGLVGFNYRASILDTYSWAAVSGIEHVGGLVGLNGSNSWSFPGSIDRSYSVGAVSASETADYIGGLLGRWGNYSTIDQSYWDIETSGQATSAGGTGKTTAEMQQQNTYQNFNFFTLWQIEEGISYPVFQNLSQYAQPAVVTLAELDGTGTAGDPYIITNADELNAMRQDLTAHYKLGNDIDLSASVVWHSGLGWAPVGTFTGSLDGDGYAIFNLAVNRPGTELQGLFGVLSNATISNLRLVDVSVQGGNNTGGLAGRANSSTIDRVYLSGSVSGSSNTGGMVGLLNGGNVQNSASAVVIFGGSNSGGLIGRTDYGTINGSYSLGSVEGNDYVGGLVGYNYRASILDTYSWAAVSGIEHVGGLVGLNGSNSWSFPGSIDRSYSVGAVSASETADYIGGLLGRWGNYSTIDQSYWDIETSDQVASAGGTGKTTSEMQQQATFAYYNFYSLWQIDEDNDYPVFQDLSQHKQPAVVALVDLAGTGTQEDPYIITTADELNAMRQDLTAHYKLGNDIDLSASVVWHSGLGWAPVGTTSANFTGSLDGDGNAIYNLAINRPTTEYQGLFGIMGSATITDLRLVDVSVYGNNSTGGLVARADSSTITRTTVNGIVVGGNSTGGLVGVINGGNIGQSASAVWVKGESNTGGLVGYAAVNVNINKCYSLGDVAGGLYEVGGLVGHLYTGTITDSYAQGSVSGGDRVGGLLGRAGSGTSYYGNTYRSYSTGLVSGTGTNVGGLIGLINRGTAGDSYWDTETSGQATSAGGTGKTTSEMQQQNTYQNFNFFTLWQIEEGISYPVFQDLSQYAQQSAVNLADLVGAGTAGDPYVITTADELNAMRQNLAAHYKLGNDIDLSASVVWNNGLGWATLGTTSANFTGSLDGDGHAIYNLAVNRPTTEYQGLFGIMGDASITDLQLVDVSVYGSNNTGGLVARADSSTITRTTVNGIVVGGNSTGGLVGVINGGNIGQSASAVWVKGESNTGGLVGYAAGNVHINQSYSLGDVAGGTYEVGGLVGYLYTGTITDSYAKGSVSGGDTVGGLLGRAGSGTSYYGYTYRSYSTGLVSGTGTYVGGLIGRIVRGTAGDSYWDTETSGQVSSSGGTGKTTAEMQQQITFTNWDFASIPIWDIEVGISYPFHHATPGMIALNPVAHSHRNDDSVGHTFAVFSNLVWTASADDTWNTITDGASGRDNGLVTYDIDSNPNPELRTGTITVSGGAGISRVFYVYQAADLELDPTSRRHDATPSGGHSFNVNGNVAWTATADDNWIVITTGTPGADAGVVTYSVTENLALSEREGTITVSGGGITRTFTVHQSGALPYLAMDPGFAEHGHTASSGHIIAVSANQDWTAGASELWITLGSANGTGDGTLEYSLDANHNRKSRSGIITLSSGDHMLNFRVTQALSWTMTTLVNPTNGGTASGAGHYADGAPVTVSVTGNPGYTFEHWTEHGLVVHAEPILAFTANRGRNLTAHFSTHPPVFTSSPVTDATQDVHYSYQVTATDPDPGDVLTISAPTKPAWLTLTPTIDGTATLSGTPGNAVVGEHNVVLQVEDLTGETATQAFTVTVANVNDPPSFTSVPVETGTQDVLYTYAIETTDPDLMHGEEELTITAQDIPGWLTLTDHSDGTATLTGTPTNDNVGENAVVLRVTDLAGSYAEQGFTITVTNVNDPPVFTSTPVTGAAYNEEYVYHVTADDPDLLHGGEELTITADEIPDWLELVPTGIGTGTLSGTPDEDDVGYHDVKLRVTDKAGLFDTQEFTITVTIDNRPPEFTSVPVETGTQDVLYTYNITAEDPDPGDVLTITAEVLPGWLDFTDHGNGTATLSGTPGKSDVGPHNVKLRVTDPGGLIGTQEFTITVANVNDPPVFTSQPVTEAEQGELYTYAINASDPDLMHGEEKLTITAETIPTWLTLTATGIDTATLSGTPTSDDVGDHPVELRVTDLGGMEATQTFTITVSGAAHSIFLPLILR